MSKKRTGYPSDVSDEEWEFCAPYLELMDEAAPQQSIAHGRYSMRCGGSSAPGAHGALLPNDLPPWTAVQPQAQRWWKAGCFAAMAGDLRTLLRLALGRQSQPAHVR